MPIHFAPALKPGYAQVCQPIARTMVTRARNRVANDTGDLPTDGLVSDDRLLHAALRHFATHGLNAAGAARKQAEAAFFAGDRQAYDWWLGITRTLDRRLAAEAERPDDDQLTIS